MSKITKKETAEEEGRGLCAICGKLGNGVFMNTIFCSPQCQEESKRRQEILTKLQSEIECMHYTARLFGNRDCIAVVSDGLNTITGTLLGTISKEIPEVELISVMSYGVQVTALFSFKE